MLLYIVLHSLKFRTTLCSPALPLSATPSPITASSGSPGDRGLNIKGAMVPQSAPHIFECSRWLATTLPGIMTVNAADVETGSHPQTSHGSEITSEIPAQESLQRTPEKSNIVDWDGPDDPQNPINWSSVRRWMTITIVSVVTFLNAFGSTVFAPSVPEVMHEFNIDSGALSSFTVSVFAIGWAVGPLVLPPLSEFWMSIAFSERWNNS
ncbi:vitamin B6 transporter bsu1 [Coccidioides immitis H538.4]|uniref:Vitamin B6 transporter bsu1 n=1 Tax=Coccidioides immitis H538.4 TaxID=396776 RepID=A0A0J8U5W5_COCIT|nr:vitamin B6 transporter bsu1 [Coccidioides immitis H538.4]